MADFDRIAEVTDLLHTDETWLGDIARDFAAGLSIKEVASRYRSTPGPIYAYQALIRALKDGEITSSPSVAQRNSARIRSWLRDKQLSDQLRAALEKQEAVLRAVADNADARQLEEQKATTASRAQLDKGLPGIYVYTLPHYLRHPVDPKTGQTLLKVGHSSRDTLYRVDAQTRVTSLPEDPVLLRIYPSDESAQFEKQFHEWLRDADHTRSEMRRAGSEWFLTSTKFLDRVARSLGLEVRDFNHDLDQTVD